jgi:2-hydroxy-3-oxopropionate reductase
MTEPALRVAFLGTGLMGAPMARHVAKVGFALTAWNRSPDKARALVQDGASIAATPEEAVRDADLVITMLSDGPAVAAVLLEEKTLAALKPGAVVIDTSSIRPEEARSHAQALKARSVGHLDAPVSGGTRGAEAGTLAIMAGGTEEDFAKALPVLKAMGRATLVGPSGLGQLAKLANQAIVGVTIGVVAEATLMMREGGADLARFRAALSGGFADSPILQVHGERMETGRFVPGGKVATQEKDMNNIMAEAEALGLDLPLCRQIRDRFAELASREGMGDLDHAALFLELLQRNERRP